eukprot:364864-Chlamydomonas_euryale.AAC.8
MFDNLAVRKGVQDKLRGARPSWCRGLASEAQGDAGDHLESCPLRFQHFPDGSRVSVNDNGNWRRGICVDLRGSPGIGPMEIAPVSTSVRGLFGLVGAVWPVCV